MKGFGHPQPIAGFLTSLLCLAAHAQAPGTTPQQPFFRKFTPPKTQEPEGVQEFKTEDGVPVRRAVPVVEDPSQESLPIRRAEVIEEAPAKISDGRHQIPVAIPRAQPVARPQSIVGTLVRLPPVSRYGGDEYFKSELRRTNSTQASFSPDQLQRRDRGTSNFDQCLTKIPGTIKNDSSFQATIENALRVSLEPRRIAVTDDIRNGYDLPRARFPERVERVENVGLLSHELCSFDRRSLAFLLGSERAVPDEETIRRLNAFVEKSNSLRRQARNDPSALSEFLDEWTQFMGCLAYTESLQTTGQRMGYKDEHGQAKPTDSEIDNDQMFQIALKKYPEHRSLFWNASTKSYERPSGVQFHDDHQGGFYTSLSDARRARIDAVNKDATLVPPGSPPVGSPEYMKLLEREDFKEKLRKLRYDAIQSYVDQVKARLQAEYPPWAVVGVYQFDPKSAGNLSPCVLQWNQLFENEASCQIQDTESDRFRALSSPGQAFNIYCGVQKILQSFNSQVNTSNSFRVHPDNFDGSRIKNSADRCVSLAARSTVIVNGSVRSKIYTHFGPLGNSVLKQPATEPTVSATLLEIPGRPARPSNMDSLMSCVDFARKQ